MKYQNRIQSIQHTTRRAQSQGPGALHLCNDQHRTTVWELRYLEPGIKRRKGNLQRLVGTYFTRIRIIQAPGVREGLFFQIPYSALRFLCNISKKKIVDHHHSQGPNKRTPPLPSQAVHRNDNFSCSTEFERSQADRPLVS